MASLVLGVRERLRSRSRLQLAKTRSGEDKTAATATATATAAAVAAAGLVVPSPNSSEWEHIGASFFPRTLRQEALATPDAEHEIIFQPPADTDQQPESEQGTAEPAPAPAPAPAPVATTVTPSMTKTDPPAAPHPASVQTSPEQSMDLYTTSSQQSRSSSTGSAGLAASRPAAPKHIPLPSISPLLDQFEASIMLDPSPESTASTGSKFASQTSLSQHQTTRVPDSRTEPSTICNTTDLNPIDQQIAPPPAGRAVDVPAHIRLPDNFPRQNTVQTDVSVRTLPAVTQECIYRQTTEIVQEAISRDIHVHHYYEYLQPIKVVEVLPARHWLLDVETGQKTEIPEPEGWMIPESMRPSKPDLTKVKKESRHYLVNDVHPNGIPEQPPSDDAEGPSQWQRQRQRQRQRP